MATLSSSLLVVTAWAGLCACFPVCSAFAVYWNADKTVDVTRFGIFPLNFTQTGNGCSNPGCHSWQQGDWPNLDPLRNGGVPQAANLTSHFSALKSTVTQWIPSPHWDGNAVFDFENYSPVWDQNKSPGTHWHGSGFQQYSEKLIRAAHPTWNSSRIEAVAAAAFSKAAIDLFSGTLQAVRSLRPRARWGYYGLPQNYLEPCDRSPDGVLQCGYDGPNGGVFREQMELEYPIFARSTALYPSIYVPLGTNLETTTAYVRSVVKASVLAAKHGRSEPIPVLPYMWLYFHDGVTLLPGGFVEACLQTSYDAGAVGVIVWGRTAAPAGFSQNFYNVSGPIFQRFLASHKSE